MKPNDLAFTNRQLAGMLKSGIPLEGALRQLARNLDAEPLRAELTALEKDLAAGVGLEDALKPRAFPAFYKSMLKIGAASNDLPGMLLMLADHYSRRGAMAARLKGLMIYPLIVLVLASAISCMVSIVYGSFMTEINEFFQHSWIYTQSEPPSLLFLWLPTVFLVTGLLGLVVIAVSPRLRDALRWRTPGFRDAGLAQTAGALAMMLRGGCSLADALDLMGAVDPDGKAAGELAAWRARLAEGNRDLADVLTPGVAFPPMFIWLVASGGENAAEGFEHAREIYHERAVRRSEMMLHSALPVSVVAVGLLIASQSAPLVSHLKHFMELMSY